MRPSWPSTSAFELVPVEIVSPTPPNTVAAPLPSITSSLPAMALMLALPVPPLRLSGIVAAANDCRGCRPTKDRVAATAEDRIRSACGADYDLHVAERAVDAGNAGSGDDRIADGTHHGRGAAAQGNELVTGHRIDQRGARRSAQVYSIAGRSNNRRRVRTAANGVEIATEDVIRPAGRADLDPY